MYITNHEYTKPWLEGSIIIESKWSTYFMIENMVKYIPRIKSYWDEYNKEIKLITCTPNLNVAVPCYTESYYNGYRIYFVLYNALVEFW